MEFREFKSLATLAASGSILQTASQLNLSPAAIHKHIKNLERELGVQFYTKVGRGLQMTQAAEIVLPHLQTILAEYETLVASVGEWKGQRTGRVRIGTGPTLSSVMLPKLLKRFRKRYPAIDLLVETGNSEVLLERLDKRTLDVLLIVWPDHVDHSDYSIEKLWPFEIVLISHAPSSCHLLSLNELRRQPFILYRRGSRIDVLIDRYFNKFDFHPKVTMRFDNPEAIKAMVASTLGISMVPFWTVSKEIRQGSLSILKHREPPLVSNIALIRQKSPQAGGPVSAFVEFAKTFADPRLLLSQHSEAIHNIKPGRN